MKWQLGALVFVAPMLCLGAPPDKVSLCGYYRDTYQKEILGKIQGGIPFELMSVFFVGDNVIEKRSIHISYDLWDEVVSIRSVGQDRVIAKVPLKEAETAICQNLEIQTGVPAPKQGRVLRLLLNPLWGERMARLQVSMAGAGGSSNLLDIHWDRLAERMPSEKMLFEKRLEP